MPFIDLQRLDRFWERVKQYIDVNATGTNTPAPWMYRSDSAGDVLGMERNIGQHTSNDCSFPYSVTADVELGDELNAYHDTTNTSYATLTTATEARTIKIYIDTQLPSDTTISSMSVSFKVGTSNISSAVWTKRTYTVKCGNNVLGSGNFTLRTAGAVTTVEISNTSLVTSPIIEIDVTAQTTNEQNVRIFGAQVDVEYTSAKEYVSIVRQGVPVVAKHHHSEYATPEYVNNAIASAIANITTTG